MFLQKKAEALAELIKQARAIQAKSKKEAEDAVLDQPTLKAVGEGIGAYDPNYVADHLPIDTLQYHLSQVSPETGNFACSPEEAANKAVKQFLSMQHLSDTDGNAVEFTNEQSKGQAQTWANQLISKPEIQAAHPGLKNEELQKAIEDAFKAQLDPKTNEDSDEKQDSGSDINSKPVEELTADEELDTAMKDLPGDEKGNDLSGEEVGDEFQQAFNEAKEEADTALPEETASLFDYLTKTAENFKQLDLFDSNNTAETATATEEERNTVATLMGNECQLCESEPSYYATVLMKAKEQGVPEEIAKALFHELSSRYPIQEDTYKKRTLDEYTAKLDSFLKAIAEYKEPTSAEDAQIALAKSAASAEEWLEKIATIDKTANILDEKSGSPEHKGKEMFNGKNNSFTNNPKQQFPGQKVFNTRDGGNPIVESVMDIKVAPAVDVYKNTKGRENVVSINGPEGTIAFMQKLDAEPVDITIGFDYTGNANAGDLQKTKSTKEQLAGAGHKTVNYLDKLDEVSDKKSVQAPLPGSTTKKQTKASVNASLKKRADENVTNEALNEVQDIEDTNTNLSFEDLQKGEKQLDHTAGFSFRGFQKTAEDAHGSAGSLGTDVCSGVGCGVSDNNKHSLNNEELLQAQKKFKESDAALQASAAAEKKDKEEKAPVPSFGGKGSEHSADIDESAYAEVKSRLEAEIVDPKVKAKLTKVVGTPATFKATVDEVLQKANQGVPPTLNQKGYDRLAKDLFGYTPEKDTEADKSDKKDNPGKKDDKKDSKKDGKNSKKDSPVGEDFDFASLFS